MNGIDSKELQAVQISESLRRSARSAVQLAVDDLEHALAILRVSGGDSEEARREMKLVTLQLHSLGSRPR
jgi:hypothetical protein